MAQSTSKVAKLSVKPSIGIDLGTTYSCVAVFQNGRPEVIANSQGNRITPSVVAFTKDGRLIGEGAEIQRKLDPANAIYNAKRFIGRTWDDPVVQANYSMYPFKVKENNNKVQFEAKNGLKTVNLTPEEIAAGILSKMKKIAEDYLEETVEDAVITVPAYFTDSQRQATKNAGKIAGLNVTRIINEPTAAAMAYGLKEGVKEFEGKHILVYDLGGGTFDVSVLEMEDDLIQVKATAGNTNLGGEDFNNLLVCHFKEEILRKHKVDLTPNCRAMNRLTAACEKLKRNLSAEYVKMSTVELDNFLPNGNDFVSTLSRAKFESICKNLFDETIKSVNQALEDAQLSKDDIDEVVLVGGSSRIPKLQVMLSNFFHNLTLNKSINPDEAVACGAAVQAAILNNDPHLAVKNMLLMDVIPLSIGVSGFGGVTHIALERNTSIPVKKTITRVTVFNDQTSARFDITEGERTMTKDNNILGSFDIYGLPPRKAGEVKFDMDYDIDENGILTTSATVRGTNKKAGITLDAKSSGKMSDEEIKRLVKEAEKMKTIDQNEENRVVSMNKLTSLCDHIKFVSRDLPATDTSDIREHVDDCLAWINKHPDAQETQSTSKYNALSDEAKHVLDLSTINASTSRSTHVLRMGKHKAKYCLKEGRELLNSKNVPDMLKAAEYFYEAYKIASEEGMVFKEIEALVCLGQTERVLTATVTDRKLKIEHAYETVHILSFVLALEKNKTLSKEERTVVLQNIQFGAEEFFKIIDDFEDEKKYSILDKLMRSFNNKDAAKNSEFCSIGFQCRVKEIKLIMKRVSASLANENSKEAHNFILDLNYPKEQAKLFAKSLDEKHQLAELIEVIQLGTLHAQGLNQATLAIDLLDGAKVDDPETIDKALMALDHLSEAKFNVHDQVKIKAHFIEGKIFMDYIKNAPKAKSCFEKVVNVSERNNFNTEEYRHSKYMLELLRKEEIREQEKIPAADRETLLNQLQNDLQKIKQAENAMIDDDFLNYLLSEYPPKHKENYQKPLITNNGSKRKAYLRLFMLYHPDKVDGSEYGEKYKVLCGEITKYINGRVLKM